jgi:hypothetical protein
MSGDNSERNYNRRGSDQRIDGLQRAVEDNTLAIADVSERLAPMEQVFDDVATVGRVGSWLKSVILWVTAVGGAVLAIYHYLSGVKID